MGRTRAENAKLLEADLRERVLSYWYDAMDRARGGYRERETFPSWGARLRATAGRAKRRLTRDPRPPLPGWGGRHLVNQSRLVWTFSNVHNRGYGDAGHDYREAARCGYRFLTECLLDPRHGGFAWLADGHGRVVDRRKLLYGQGFALYALVEYHRATGLPEPLEHARSLFARVQERMHDEQNSGWIEHCDADFTPLAPHVLVPGMPGTGLKSANAHLHWMEALSELAEAIPEPPVLAALEESVRINTTRFFPTDPGAGRALLEPDWSVPAGRPESISYGHNLEFAWLLVRAHQVLGASPDWDHFDALVGHAIEFGFDHEEGGFHSTGPASGRDKIWWVQAEGLAALTDGLLHRRDERYERTLDRLLEWIVDRQRLASGLWAPRVDARGRPGPILAHGAFKSAYHEVRGVTKFVAAFSAGGLD
jgi:mannobiose 2-epimerase